jgi:hypothetical protein
MSDIVERLNRAGDLAIPGEPCAVFYDAADEIERLRTAIRRIAEQDATLSVQGGNVTVMMDGTLTDAELDAVDWAARHPCLFTDDPALDLQSQRVSDTLRSLLSRLA